MKKVFFICLYVFVSISGWSSTITKMDIEQCIWEERGARKWAENILEKIDFKDFQEQEKTKVFLEEFITALREGNEPEQNKALEKFDNEDLVIQIVKVMEPAAQQAREMLDKEELPSQERQELLEKCIDRADLTPVEKEIVKIGFAGNGLVLNDINETIKTKVRKQFQFLMPSNEEILYVSNKPGFFTGIRSVITDRQVYFATENSFAVPLEYFSKSIYKEGFIHNIPMPSLSIRLIPNRLTKEEFLDFFENHRDDFAFRVPIAKLTENKEEGARQAIAVHLRRAADSFIEQEKNKLDKQETFWVKFNQIPTDKRAAFLDKHVEQDNWRYHYAKALVLYREGHTTEAFAHWEQANNLLGLPPWIDERNYELFDLLFQMKKYKLARFGALMADVDQTYKYKAEKEFTEHFFELEPSERKMIVLVDEIIAFQEDGQIIPLDIHHLPKGLVLDPGNPSVGDVYIAHPYHPHKYILFERGYEWRLLKDEIDEYCRIMKYIGAVSCKVNTRVGNSTDEQTSSSLRVQGEVHGEKGVMGVKAGGKIAGGYSNEEWERISKYKEAVNSISHTNPAPYKFRFTGKENWLIWYPYKDWNKLVEDVREGNNPAEYEERFFLRDLNQTQQVDCEEVKAELEVYMNAKVVSKKGGIGFAYERCKASKAEEEKSVEKQIKVVFPTSKSKQ